MLATATAEDIRAALEYQKRNRVKQFFKDTGPYRRELYPKHLEFFRAGATFKERLFMAANRVGKSESGAFEGTAHLTGIYPAWWQGKRFSKPTDGWACGTTSETTRDIVQEKLLGPVGHFGTGMIPAHLIAATSPRRGVPNAIETIWVTHASGGKSKVSLKTYEQGRTSFEGTAKDWIWCDEEPPEDCYTEMLFRTATTNGITMITFTPLKGRSKVVQGFLEPENEDVLKFKMHVKAGWGDVPHLSPDQKAALIATTPPYQLDARTKGEPSLGSGAIYPIAESEISCKPFDIPESWPKAYAMDVGWNRTAAVWGARDPGSGVVYVYSEHYQGQGEPASHAQAIRARGEWMKGVIDPACLGSSQIDGRNLMDLYTRLGLKLEPAVNSVESGITEVWNLMVGGRIKVFESCGNWWREFRNYHRDDKGNGKIVKRDDHLMDATRYLVVSGREHMKLAPKPHVYNVVTVGGRGSGGQGWMGV